MKKRMRELVKDLRQHGFVVTLTGGGHLKVTHPDKPGIVFMPSTPSDHRAVENTLAQLRRTFGYIAPWKRK